MKSSQKFSLRSRLKSFHFAWNGLSSLFKYEHNSRIHLCAALIAIAAGIFLGLSSTEWILLVIVTGLVFITELFNSAIESLADRIDPEWHDLIMKAKDYSAAAVLISALIAIIAGAIIFIPKIF
jgi:diacylglycerol kinase